MIGVVVKLKVADGKNAEFEEVAKDLVSKVKANESGTLFYQLFKSQEDGQTYFFIEHYASKEALDAHGKSDYFKAAGPKLGACLAGAPEMDYLDLVE